MEPFLILAIGLSAAAVGLLLGGRIGKRVSSQPRTTERRRRIRRLQVATMVWCALSLSVLAFLGIVPFLIVTGAVYGGFLLSTWVRALLQGRRAFRS